jgi:DNA-binding NarL/FixJ family response regulator
MKILIAEDHEFVHETLQISFSKALEHEKHSFLKCLCCKDVYDAVEQQILESEIIHFALLDFCMPSYDEKKIFSGKEAALHIKDLMPDCKIIIMTASMDTLTIIEIIQQVRPDGFLYKSDLGFNELTRIIKEISNGGNFRSKNINDQYQKGLETNIFIEPINRKILSYLALGYKIKEICEELHLTEPTINKRIAKIKEELKINNSSGLLREAKKRGLV